MYERFTDRARKVMQLASEEAARWNEEYIGTEHILHGLLKEGAGIAASVLNRMGVEAGMVESQIGKLNGPKTKATAVGKASPIFPAVLVVENSLEEARNLGHRYVGTEHLLLGLLQKPDGAAAQILMNLGLALNDVRREVLNVLGHYFDSRDNSECLTDPHDTAG